MFKKNPFQLIRLVKMPSVIVIAALCGVLMTACDGDCNIGSTVPLTSTPLPAGGGGAQQEEAQPQTCTGRFCKYDNTGVRLDDLAENWSCVEDTATKKFWEVKSLEASSARYNLWSYALTGTTGVDCGGFLGACTPAAYVDAVNAALSEPRPCGTTKVCRIPTHSELIDLAMPTALLPSEAGKLTEREQTYLPDKKFFPDHLDGGSYCTDTIKDVGSRQVIYGVSIPANTRADAFTLYMAPVVDAGATCHTRLICE
ncbi:MAG: hypothetical protein QJT81_19445 [Candidatus Thiothrix putei]|uniref:Uncharacterized protein n=1 Tax=Candidatus Thiothrix putei TaxID=3080811 RepID=A0AA95HF58_9GAMM|nr:MAG: hypothetical protein QJT81_19445 [Candidatus Thiothrix putei]